jgi:hypothetical protein
MKNKILLIMLMLSLTVASSNIYAGGNCGKMCIPSANSENTSVVVSLWQQIAEVILSVVRLVP